MVVILNGEVLTEGRKFYGHYVVVQTFPWIHVKLRPTDVISVEHEGVTKVYNGYSYISALSKVLEPDLWE